jgi:hypothetical protein
MIRVSIWASAGALLTVLSGLPATAQTNQFWPEVDTYAKLGSNTRFRFQVKQTREGGQTNQFQFGPSFEFYVKPLVELRDLSELPANEAQSRFLLLSVGYLYFPERNSAAENRVELIATPSYPLKWRLVLSDRNRVELRFVNGNFFWRYRNRLGVQRVFKIHSYRFTPYARCEVYWDSQYHKWYDTAVSAGTKLPIAKKVELDTYYQHQNQTNNVPNRQVNSLGLILNVFF